jgi:hypothetical protein
MHVPTEEELAAIAAAYMTLRADADANVNVTLSLSKREAGIAWQTAARIGDTDPQTLRALPSGSRWRAAGRASTGSA